MFQHLPSVNNSTVQMSRQHLRHAATDISASVAERYRHLRSENPVFAVVLPTNGHFL